MSESSTDAELSRLLPKRKSSSSRSRGVVVSFHNIHYTVRVRANRKKTTKVILNNISGIFKPGLNAILGRTGSGKTTLLNILAARNDPKGLLGTVLIDGMSINPNFRLISGYVLQNDVLMGILTVREHLTFCAALRLPKHYSKQQRRRRVDNIIKELELGDCADTKVGSDLNRGISGGERKRICIGMELMIKPTTLFLDEPTSGLDATTAMSVMCLLARLSQRGHTIIASIHQARYGIFRLFTKMHLLAEGETVYHGPAEECLEYFSSLGHECDKQDNPADFVLDVIVKSSIEKQTSLSECYRRSNYHQLLQDDSESIHDRYILSSEPTVTDVGYPTSWLVQFGWICQRSIRILVRHPMVIKSQYIVTTILSLIFGVIFFQLDESTSSFQNRLGALFFSIILNVRMANVAIPLFIEEKVLFRHETSSGYYRVSAYFLGKLVANEIPQRLGASICSSVLVYFMIGLRPGLIPFLKFTLNMAILSCATCSVSLLIGASVNTLSLGNAWFRILFMSQIIFSGFLINIESMFKWLQIFAYISIPRHAMNAASIIELKDRQLCDPYPYNNTCIFGNEYLQSQGIDYSEWGLWSSQIAMAAICGICLFFTYLSLRLMRKYN